MVNFSEGPAPITGQAEGERSIPFNIWDDYFDDDYVPSGEKQSTYGFIESDEFSEEEEQEIIDLIFEFIQKLDMTGVEVEHDNDRIDFFHLTHVRRELLVKELQESGLSYKGVSVDFYSES